MEKATLIIDSHVHIYDCYDPEAFFLQALANLKKETRKSIKEGRDPIPLLLLTEGKELDFFNGFKKNPLLPGPRMLKFKALPESCSQVLMDGDTPLLWILQGRQIITAEKLEVLNLATDVKIADGLPIAEVVEKIAAKKGIAVLAWGVGKWFFKRGKVIAGIIKDCASASLFIGDNSARPTFWRMPALFELGRNSGLSVIPGSDPLPFPGEIKQTGSFGFMIEGEFDKERPAESLHRLLVGKEEIFAYFGKRDGFFRFFKRQLRMFLKKHLGR